MVAYAAHILDAAHVTGRVAQLATQGTDQRAQQRAGFHTIGLQTMGDLDQFLQRHHSIRLPGQTFQQPELPGRKLDQFSIQPDTVLAGVNS